MVEREAPPFFVKKFLQRTSGEIIADLFQKADMLRVASGYRLLEQ
jgi:hypothetical protein